jgi:hypothetical protein
MTNIFGKYHSFNDKPALVEYSDKGKIHAELWCYNELKHRENDKPAWIDYTTRFVYWHYMGKSHRNDKSKYTNMNINVYTQTIHWNQCHHGEFAHRECCPINNPTEYAKEIFNYISKEKIEACIKSLYG